ncbi:PAS domain-containing sensor histidine kinase [Methanolobus sp. ZRKC3]|uniref:PAS domain S-box protein n=1 Tax=Methanolobus sp. ZRKC3 TaxID=3125786 RepID=UPI00324BB854
MVSKQLEDKFQMLFDYSSDAILIYDLNSKILEVNQVTCEFTGYSRDELLRKSVMDLDSPEFAEKIPLHIKELQKKKKAFFESILLCKDGSTVPIELSNRLIEYGGKTAVISIARDITERKHAQNILEKSERKFRILFENANDGIYLQELNGRIFEVNEVACQQMGYSRDEMLQLSLKKLDVSEDDAQSRLKKVLDDGHAIFETEGVRKDGSCISLEISSRVIEYGGKPAILCITRDVTGRKHAENELLYAKLTAEASTRAKSDFMTAMSHELRTPLNIIIGFADMLCDSDYGVLNEDHLKYAGYIHENGNKLLQMINELLEISEIERGELELHISEFSAYDAIEEVLAGLNPKQLAKKICIVCDIDGEFKTIKADRNKFKHIMYNLLDNSIKFNLEGGSIAIEITNEGNFMQISIKDTGIGISSEKLQDIFLPFKQIDSGICRKYAGCGIGLVLANKFIKLHGGEIWVESEVNKGSTFTFNLPVILDSTALFVDQISACLEERSF